MKKTIKAWYCEVCKDGVVAPTPMNHVTRYGCINCLAVYFPNKKRDTRYKPMDKKGWLRKEILPTVEEVIETIKKRG